MEAGLRARILEIRIFGAEADRLPNTTCFAAPGIAAATLLMALDLAGVAVSAGSACSSGKIGPSHVLDAMGAPPHIAGSAIRVSVGWTTSEADVTGFLEALDRTLAVIRRTGRAA
jgi:cysteine desulfurase